MSVEPHVIKIWRNHGRSSRLLSRFQDGVNLGKREGRVKQRGLGIKENGNLKKDCPKEGSIPPL